MRTTIQRTLVAPLGIALIILLALPVAALANTSGAIAQTGGMSVTLPMAGSGLSVVVQLDVVGNVSQVAIDPVGTFTATKLGPHAVTFDTADGTSQVKINAKGDKLAVKASAPTLASFRGSGTWSADLFGTSSVTTVGYTIGAAGTDPTLAIDSVASQPDVTVVQDPPKTRTGPKDASASARISFTRDGFTKKLDIKISVKKDGARPASLKITLSGKDKQALSGTLASLIGTHSWAGHLCDGTAVAFTYDVVDPGSVVFGAATGATATSKTDKHALKVTFDGTKTKVNVSLKQEEDQTWDLKVSTKTDKCKHTPAPDPTVSTPVSPDATKSDKSRDHGDHGATGTQKAKADAKLASAHTTSKSTSKTTGKTAHSGQSSHKGTSKHHGG